MIYAFLFWKFGFTRILRNFRFRKIAPFPPPKRTPSHLQPRSTAGPIQELS